MKYSILCAVLLFPCISFAQTPAIAKGSDQARLNRLAKYDTNKDGKLDESEKMAAKKEMQANKQKTHYPTS